MSSSLGPTATNSYSYKPVATLVALKRTAYCVATYQSADPRLQAHLSTEQNALWLAVRSTALID